MTLDSIIERLEKAEIGGDREIDAAITGMFGREGPYGTPGCAGYVGIADFTSSVDCAIRLARSIFPECTISTDCWPSKAHVAICAGPTPSPIVEGEGHHSSQAIATVIAILKAKQMGVGE